MATHPLEAKRYTVFVKRLVAAVAVSALSVIGIAPAATAASSSSSDHKIVKISKKPAPIQNNAIDWD